MKPADSSFHFASAPVSWGVGDCPDAGWEQPYEQVLDEIAAAGYSGTELGPYGYLPADSALLSRSLSKRRLTMLSSFVPVPLSDPSAAREAVEQVRKVGALLAALGARLLVLADAQSPERVRIAGRVPADGSRSLRAEQWRQVGRMIDEIERAAADLG